MPAILGWVFLAVSLWGAWFTWNTYRPVHGHPQLATVSFFAGWLTGELALHHIAWQAAATAGFVWGGVLDVPAGRVALGITLLSWMGLLGCLARAARAAQVVEQALRDGLGATYEADIRTDLGGAAAAGIRWSQVLLPFPIRHPDVGRVRDVVYGRASGRDLKLDVYRHRNGPTGCPVLLYVHGGGWIVGSKNEQGLPMMQQLAAQGWVCATVDYRLSPHATFPDHLIDVKRAIAWVREHIHEYGGDPSVLVISGGSAGGHLASLAALTANDADYQPGFERADTHVSACVSFYGVYDFTDRHGIWPHGGLADVLHKHVMKASRDEAGAAYDAASPMSRVHADAPPFFVIHGTHDTLVPVEEARRFVRLLRERAHAPCVYAEIPGAQHAFEIFPSMRASFVVRGVERFVAWVASRSAVAATPRRAAG